MSVWTDVVGQERAVAVLDAAARSARTLAQVRRAGPDTGPDTGPDAAGSGPAGANAGSGPDAGQGPDADASAMTHAWLITGPPGSGRSVAARACAAALQ